MTPENFIYWLNGFLEIQKPEFITKDQIKEIENHIKLVLKKETPTYNFGDPVSFECNYSDDFKNPYKSLHTGHSFLGKWPGGPPASC